MVWKGHQQWQTEIDWSAKRPKCMVIPCGHHHLHQLTRFSILQLPSTGIQSVGHGHRRDHKPSHDYVFLRVGLSRSLDGDPPNRHPINLSPKATLHNQHPYPSTRLEQSKHRTPLQILLTHHLPNPYLLTPENQRSCKNWETPFRILMA